MIDFGILPPEINSGRMYAGAGAGPLIAAAAAWDGLACGLVSTAVSYRSAVTELSGGPWLGPASRAMLAAAAPYVAWLNATAAHAEQAAAQAGAAVAAYEDAFAMTVPPPVIAANRAELLLLIATNFFGQNTPAIAATEAQYAEMWAQDATAMYVYAGSSAAASNVTPFKSPPQTTNPAGLTGQAAAVTHAAGTPTGTPTALPSTLHLVPALHTLAQPATSTSPTLPAPTVPVSPKPPGPSALTLANLNTAWKFGLSWTNGSSMHTLCAVFRYNLQNDELPKAAGAVKDAMGGAAKAAGAAKALGPTSPLVAGLGGGSPVAAGMGQASHVGALSVPGNFPGAAPAATGSPVAAGEAAVLPGGQRAGGTLAGMPGVPGISGRATSGDGLRFVPQYGYRHKVMARPPGAG